MFRLWARTFKDNHLLQDTIICDDRSETRTHKVFDALEKVCYAFDLGKQSGWILILRISKNMIKPASFLIIL